MACIDRYMSLIYGHIAPELPQQRERVCNVCYVGAIGKSYPAAVAKKAGGEYRQSRVFGAANADRAAQGVPAPDDIFGHKKSPSVR